MSGHHCNWRCYDGYSHADPPPKFLKCGITECRLPNGHDGKHSDGTREWSNPNCVDCGCVDSPQSIFTGGATPS
jgi:hypothetical protein